ncbi:homocysteine S-methyltransferase family protein [Paralimibaculum aggregatum]|uniref:Homocysteine S-methyltransferase family protein n=1 Tax=Paralimibaculum aggregatum TaxID=3036245 RepID=A0ABQ6LPM6_9RHOB|nr:homocysteine S-methyltransferase family protein [Limibaculum sp. NKW23]GMG82315.1 homocysteine S-methyltransferase family protein [Limibaculum sp. NKW23]
MSRIVLLDGGMGQELILRSRHPVHPLWGTFVMREAPDIVRAVHEDYIAAGARMITVNTYTATPARLARDGYPEAFGELQQAACRLAEEAREASAVDGVRIAGCLPPLIGSYRADLTPGDTEALDDYRRIAEIQAEHVDVFLCETMTSGREARLAATAAAETGRPVWVALTLRDGGDPHLRGGETIAEAAAALADLPVAAVLANCCHPESIDAATDALGALGLPWGGYANGFKSVAALRPGGTVAALEPREDLGPEVYAGFALGWAAAGAAIVGGCCEVGPEHIAATAQRLADAGYETAGDLA